MPGQSQQKIDVFDILEPEPDKFAVLVDGNLHKLCDSQESADVAAKLAGKDHEGVEVKQLASFVVKLPEVHVLVVPEKKNDKFLLARTVLQRLGVISSEIMAGVAGDAPVVQVANPGDVPPDSGGPPKLRVVKR